MIQLKKYFKAKINNYHNNTNLKYKLLPNLIINLFNNGKEI